MNELPKNSALLIALCLLLLASCASPEPAPEPEVNVQELSEAQVQVADLEGLPVLLEASLDDGNIDGFEIIDGEWGLTEAQDGNVVAEIDNRDGASNPAFRIGDANWADYSLNYRFKYLADSTDEAEIYFNFFISEDGPYQVAMGMGDGAYVILGHIPNAVSWDTLAEESASLTTNEWHDLRLDVTDGQISLFIDGEMIFTVEDDSSSAGTIEIGVSAGTHG